MPLLPVFVLLLAILLSTDVLLSSLITGVSSITGVVSAGAGAGVLSTISTLGVSLAITSLLLLLLLSST